MFNVVILTPRTVGLEVRHGGVHEYVDGAIMTVRTMKTLALFAVRPYLHGVV